MRQTKERHSTVGSRALGDGIRKIPHTAGPDPGDPGAPGRFALRAWLMQVENGRTDPHYQDLINLARELRIELNVLIAVHRPT